MSKHATKPKHITVNASSKIRQRKPEVIIIPKSQPEPSAEAMQPVANPFAGTPLEYAVDAFQRSVLFWDIIRKRADNFLEYEAAGMPPVLNFEYEPVLDARTFKQPCNYALVKITQYGDACLEDCLDPAKPPVIIVDPRAGQSPGIGGFKRESEVGIALHQGHPVYFVIFYPKPEPHQTILDVLAALRRFVEHVEKLHSGKPPILYGNCQAGWMLALLSADCSGLPGPAILCGAPLSYWAGEPGKNMMQLEGGLCGGVWLDRFMGDLGAGEFDGAWLVFNFEILNPANAVWTKYYNLYSKVDTEEERFLSFERWWNGFYRFSTEEITATVSQLFIGNEIEDGKLEIHPDCYVDLKNIKNPLLIFASQGDEITPPYEALAWVAAVYKTTEELKAAGQRIVYMIHPSIGHLGIFVSAEVAKKEHNAILGNIDQLDMLKPGLYEMKVLEGALKEDCEIPTLKVKFEERAIEDIASHYNHKSFERVRQVSEFNDNIYSQWVSPWVQMASNPFTATAMRWLHPMRTSRYMWSQWLNPAMWGVTALAPLVRSNRMQVAQDDPMRKMEGETSKLIADGLNETKKSIDKRRSKLVACDKLLTNYESEYHYLFSLVENTSNDPGTDELEKYYSMPNVARRLLESFMAFRKPSKGSLHAMLEATDFDPVQRTRIYRFVNVHSHEDHVAAPEHDPSLLAETPQIMRSVLALMEHVDGGHYTEMLQVIGKPAHAQVPRPNPVAAAA
jgi:hypothetical protein